MLHRQRQRRRRTRYDLAEDIFSIAIEKRRVIDEAILALNGVVVVLGSRRWRKRPVIDYCDAFASAVALKEIVSLGSIRRGIQSLPVEFKIVRGSKLHAVAGNL